MKYFNCEYYIWIEKDYYVNDYNIKGVNAPDWCPYYNTPDHEDGENGWETLRETNMMEWNP